MSRVIESTDRRLVHFVFNPRLTYPISRLARELNAYLEGGLDEQRKKDNETYESYCEALLDDSVEEIDPNWLSLTESPY